MGRQDTLCTEFAFTLPRGLNDTQGRLHRQGIIRLATAKDELWVQKKQIVQENPAYGFLLMLSRTVVRLGSLTRVSPELLEGLVLRDLGYLREFYNRVNQQENAQIPAQCPQCQAQFQVELMLAGKL